MPNQFDPRTGEWFAGEPWVPPAPTASRLIDEPDNQGVVDRLRRVGTPDDVIEQTLQEQEERVTAGFTGAGSAPPGPEGRFDQHLEALLGKMSAPAAPAPSIGQPAELGGPNAYPGAGGSPLFGSEAGGVVGDFLKNLMSGATSGPGDVSHTNPLTPGGAAQPPGGAQAAEPPPGLPAPPGPGGPFGPGGPGAPPGPAGVPTPPMPQMRPPPPNAGQPSPQGMLVPGLPPGGPIPQPGLGGEPPGAGAEPGFMEALMKNPNLLEFGLRMMRASQPTPGSTVGPTFAGAAGQAGLGQIASNRQREAAAASAAFAREKFETETAFDEKKLAAETAVDREKIEADKQLKIETLRLRQSTETASQEIARYRADLAARAQGLDENQFAVDVTNSERDELKDVRESDAYLLADKAGQDQLENEVHRKWNRVRVRNDLEPMTEDEAQAAPAGQDQVIEGKRHIVRDGKVYRQK